ncbi:MAG: hypothetical protein KatS3mg015_1363 [Fimbriimonadales bacterium]|nr:MAG: hypothetical protein KatS3mg015_1363 [Fimbriimonadales bacterium]
MESLGAIGRMLVVVGLGLVAVGLLLVLVQRFPGLRIGRLPGDILIQRDNFTFYFPITTMLVASAILSLLALLFQMLKK